MPVLILPPSMEVVPDEPRSDARRNVVNPVKSILSAFSLIEEEFAFDTSYKSAYTFVPIVFCE